LLGLSAVWTWKKGALPLAGALGQVTAQIKARAGCLLSKFDHQRKT